MAVQEISESVFLAYESALQGPRKQFSDFVKPLFMERNPQVLLLFWINFSYLGVGMTEPVEHWIRRAGEKCKTLGYHELGIQLCKHAIHESDHHLMMIEDTEKLVSIWNKQYEPKLKADTLLKQSFPNCVLAYRDLHEYHINGKTPYCQIAIEYEVENLSASYGTQMLEHTCQIAGTEIKDSLSFVDEHARIDVAHTLYNRKAITRFLEDNPDTQGDLVAAGIQALEIYGAFLGECYSLAKDMAS